MKRTKQQILELESKQTKENKIKIESTGCNGTMESKLERGPSTFGKAEDFSNLSIRMEETKKAHVASTIFPMS